MFFRNRKKYNGTVDIKLNNEYQIKTRDNKAFPGMLAYLEIIDKGWETKMNEDECAMYVATLYYCGIVKEGVNAEEVPGLKTRIEKIGEFGKDKKLISTQRYEKFMGAIRKTELESAD